MLLDKIDLCKLRSYALHIWQTMVFLSFRVYSGLVIKETIVYDKDWAVTFYWSIHYRKRSTHKLIVCCVLASLIQQKKYVI